jgi:hypothetical protein
MALGASFSQSLSSLASSGHFSAAGWWWLVE